MAETTGISWCDHTWNPWIGCMAVSQACAHCYAEALTNRWGGDFGVRRRTSVGNWKQPYRWNRKAREAGVRRRVFTLSLGDFWDNKVDPAWRLDALDVIRQCDALDWLILTKRPMNIRVMLVEAFTTAREQKRWPLADWLQAWLQGNSPPLNVWLGTTVENQEEADRRIPCLLGVPATVRFLSCEPLLEAVETSALTMHIDQFGNWRAGAGIHWVICGGESGHGARPMHPDWARSLRDQCRDAGVSFFMKQWGEYEPLGPIYEDDDENLDRISSADEKRAVILTQSGGVWGEFDGQPPLGSWMMERVGTKKAGHLLDGLEHHEYPR